MEISLLLQAALKMRLKINYTLNGSPLEKIADVYDFPADFGTNTI